MANVVRDPKEHPEAIIPDLSADPIAKFTKDQVSFVYGSIWKQRYFTKIGDDYFPEPAQWDVVNHAWKPYLVKSGTDWWEPFYPADNMKRPTGPLCDGCHSVDYNIHTKQVAEWNVGCERCHGPGSKHVEHPERGNIQNPAHMDYVAASDSCIQCHSQGRPRTSPIEGVYYDWPVGYTVGLRLKDFWSLEDHTLGQLSFTHFPDGTAHKNRMQGNDFVQSVMYRRGVTCFSCHDAHGAGGARGIQGMRRPGIRGVQRPQRPRGPHRLLRTATGDAARRRGMRKRVRPVAGPERLLRAAVGLQDLLGTAAGAKRGLRPAVGAQGVPGPAASRRESPALVSHMTRVASWPAPVGR